MPVNPFDNYYLSYMPEKEILLPHITRGMAADLEARIIRGDLAPHTKLPPQRELADYLDVNLSTVTRAYKLCEQKGLIYGISGSGTFVSPNARQKLEIFNRANQSCIELGLLEPFYDCNELVAQAARSVINRQGAVRLFEYADPIGAKNQLAAAKGWLMRFGVQADEEHLIISSGSQNALTIALLSLFEPGDKIAADCFTYSNLKGLANMLHIQLVPVEGDEKGMLPEELERAARQQRLAGVYLMPDCANPTAITIPQTRREALAEVIRRQQLVLIEDDGYSWLTELACGGVHHSDQAAGPVNQEASGAACIQGEQRIGITRMITLLPEQTIYIHSTSKSLCAGLRVSFTVFPEQFREQMTNGILHISLKSVALSAEIITRIIQTDLADQLMQRKILLAEARSLIFHEVFPEYDEERGDGGAGNAAFFRFLRLPDGMDAEQFEEAALRRGVHVLGGHRFLIAPNSRKAYVRVALTSPKTEEELRRGLLILREMLESIR